MAEVPDSNEKYNIVINKNTFYSNDSVFQEKYERDINALKKILLDVFEKVEREGLSKNIFENLLLEGENGLCALLALTGFANESLKRLITVVRVSDDKEISELLLMDKWPKKTDNKDLKEWGDDTILKLIKKNEFFRKGIVNLFFEGGTSPF